MNTLHQYKRVLLPLAAMALSAASWGMPARPGLVRATQPDGTEITVTLHGDEFLHWASTPEGYTLLPDTDGYWTVAEKRNGKVGSSDIRYTGTASLNYARERGIEKALRPTLISEKSKSMRAASTQIDGTFPSQGERKLLMLLINYADTKTTFTQADFNNLMNAQGFNGSGSFRDYYLENSYGKLDITTTVTRWVTLSNSKSFYGADGAETMILEALAMLDGEIDLADFDNDGDGILDGLSVVHQGTGQEASGNPGEIWSHSGIIYGKTMDGIQLRRYTIVPERLDDKITTIGVTCHEFGHNLGAPDFYDSDYAQSGGEYPGTGVWDLMASGAWNGELSGNRPAGTNMWQKIQLGWVTPQILSSTTNITGMKGATFEPVAYRFDTTIPGEYFILENRRREGTFDSALPSEGLLIYHANDNLIAANVESNTLNSKYPQTMYVVCAGAETDPGNHPDTYGWVNSSAAPFPGSSNRTSFTDTSIPSSRSISGRYSYKGLTHIAQGEDGTISFDFICYDTPLAPVGLKATVVKGVVSLSWEAPQSDGITGYNVYRNGEFLEKVSTNGYTDSSIGALTDLTYSVDTEYASGLLSPPQDVNVFIPANIVKDLTADTQGGDVTLQWNLNTRFTRMSGDVSNFLTDDYAATTVEMAHKFRAEDLAVYKGYKIRKLAFIPVQGPREINCSVIVYEVDPVSGERKVVSERALSELGMSSMNDVTLRPSVEITAEKDLWIALKYTSNTGSVQFLTDLGPVMSGYGNLVSIDGGEWKADDSLGGNFWMYATLSEPAATDVTNGPTILPAEYPHVDTALPQGFAIYRDGELVGTCTGRKFIDTQVPEGEHVYGVSSLYKGNNESGWMTMAVSVETGGILDIPASQGAVSVAGSVGQIKISGCYGLVRISDLTGRIVSQVVSDGNSSVSLPAGVYLVVAGKSSYKVIVR